MTLSVTVKIWHYDYDSHISNRRRFHNSLACQQDLPISSFTKSSTLQPTESSLAKTLQRYNYYLTWDTGQWKVKKLGTFHETSRESTKCLLMRSPSLHRTSNPALQHHRKKKPIRVEFIDVPLLKCFLKSELLKTLLSNIFTKGTLDYPWSCLVHE